MGQGREGIGRQVRLRDLAQAALAAALMIAALALPAGARAALQELAEAERAWIARNPVIRVGLDRAGEPPFEVPGSDGKHYGISVELLRRAAQRLDLRLDLRTYKDRPAAIDAAQRNEVDVIPSMLRTKRPGSQFLFTQHYYYSHSALLKHPGFASAAVPTIAIVKGRQPAEALARRVERFNALEVADAQAGVAAVREGRAEAYAGSVLSALHTAGAGAAALLEELREESLDAGELRLAVRSDLPLLASALDKALASFSPAEMAELSRGWLAEGELRPRVPAFVMRDDEKALVAAKGKLRVAYDTDFEPFSFVQANEPAGMSIDYLRAAAERLGLAVEFLRGQTFSQALDAVVEGNADVLVAAARTPDRRRYLRFAGPTFSQPTALITRLDTEHITGLADLEPQKVALPEGYFLRERLAREFPQARVTGCRDTEDCLRAVVDGQAVATLGNLAVISTLIERRFPGRLRVAGTIPDAPSELYFALGIDKAALQSLLQRALDSLPPEKHARIRARWRTAQYQEGVSIGKVLKVALPVFAAALLILGFIAYSNRRLAREVGKRRATEAELRVQRDRAEAATQAKSSFLAVMSHEIRTPMHGVLGILDVLGHTSLNADQQGLVKTASTSARSLLALLNDLLDFSKIEAGKMRLEATTASLRTVAEGAVNLFAMKAFEKGVGLTLAVDPVVAEAHRFDEVRVGQVLTNLVSNAIKFTSEGAVAVEIGAEPVEGGVQRVHIRVRDSGIGIDAADQAQLFEPFEQAESSTTRRYGGTGLGLAICRRIADQMGADLTLQSAKGSGSTFTFSAPLPVAGQMAPGGAPDAGAAARTGARILVVEDHPVNQLVVRRQLELLGHRVTIAGDGAQGLEAWRAGHFDLVLADHHMPVMDGEEFVRRLREEEAGRDDGRRIPVLGLSADEREAMRGVDARLLKPIVAEELDRAIARWVPDVASERRPTWAPRAPAHGPFDEEHLARTFGDEATICATLAELAAALAPDLEAARAALRDRRMDDARRMAHRILGAARAVGAGRLERAAARLHEGAGSSDFAVPAAAFGELEAAAREAIEAARRRRPVPADKIAR